MEQPQRPSSRTPTGGSLSFPSRSPRRRAILARLRGAAASPRRPPALPEVRFQPAAPDTAVVARRAAGHPVAGRALRHAPTPTYTKGPLSRSRSPGSGITWRPIPNTDLSDNAQYWIGESLLRAEEVAGRDRRLRQAPASSGPGATRPPRGLHEGLRAGWRLGPKAEARRPAPVRHPRVPHLRGSAPRARRSSRRWASRRR